MKQKTLFFILVGLFVACLILFLPILAIPLNYFEPGFLESELAIAQYGYGGGSSKKDSSSSDDDDGPPPPPPDEISPETGGFAFDPENPTISVYFPPGSLPFPIDVETFFAGLPPDIPQPPGGIGVVFYFGAWIQGQGITISSFDGSIVITVPYDTGVSQLPGQSGGPFQEVASLARPELSQLANTPLTLFIHPAADLFKAKSTQLLLPPGDEQNLRLNMYNRHTNSWEKLCSSVNPHTKQVSGVLASAIPVDDGGNTLLAIAVDDTPPLTQVVDNQGNTTISLEGVNTRLQVPPGTVEPGTHFEVTLLPDIPANSTVRLLDNPLDVKACKIDHTANQNSAQVTLLPKPLSVEFDSDAGIVTTAGGINNVTAVQLQNTGQWVDLEEFGYNVIRAQDRIVVDTDSLGTFTVAVK